MHQDQPETIISDDFIQYAFSDGTHTPLEFLKADHFDITGFKLERPNYDPKLLRSVAGGKFEAAYRIFEEEHTPSADGNPGDIWIAPILQCIWYYGLDGWKLWAGDSSNLRHPFIRSYILYHKPDASAYVRWWLSSSVANIRKKNEDLSTAEIIQNVLQRNMNQSIKTSKGHLKRKIDAVTDTAGKFQINYT